MKIFIALFALLLIAVVGFAIYKFYLHTNTSEFTLIKESGNVYYKEAEDSEYTEITADETDFKAGTFIKTNEGSYARIFLPDNSLISIDEKTEIQINYKGNDVNIHQLIGKTWNRVQKVTDREYKVETPNTIAAVRGTIFGVGVEDDNNSRVFVEESKVNVGKYEKKDGQNDILEDVGIEENETAKVKRDDTSFTINKEDTEDDFKQSFWYRRNKIVDEEYTKIKDKSRRDLIKLLRRNLSQREDFLELRLGKLDESIDINEIKNRLADVYKMTSIDENSCTDNSTVNIDNGIAKIQLYKDYIFNADATVELLTKLKEVCADGEIDPNDAAALEVLVNQVND